MSKSKYRVVPKYPRGFHVQEEMGSCSFWPFKTWWTRDYFFDTQKAAEEFILRELFEEEREKEFYKNNPPYRFP